MQPPVESVRRGPSPSPLRRRDKSPVKTASGSTYPYEYPAARARPPVERTHPYEYPASRARPAWRSAATEYDDLDEDEDLYGLEPSYTERSSRQEPLDRPSIEPEAAIELDDDLDEDLDLDMFSAYAYANTRRGTAGVCATSREEGEGELRGACVDIRVDSYVDATVDTNRFQLRATTFGLTSNTCAYD
ncbi:hypothetical protein V492_06207 [Pseudogymnoascus sp. VKM F-4246]|nr:hypothetical protein V492_06207 [Pseudogymnoascus sp. VKM F-4246]